jgi:hypothetical protein
VGIAVDKAVPPHAAPQVNHKLLYFKGGLAAEQRGAGLRVRSALRNIRLGLLRQHLLPAALHTSAHSQLEVQAGDAAGSRGRKSFV